MKTGHSFRACEHPYDSDRLTVQGVEFDRVRGRPHGHRQIPENGTPGVRNRDSVPDPRAEHGLAPFYGLVNFVGQVWHARADGQESAELVQDVTLLP